MKRLFAKKYMEVFYSEERNEYVVHNMRLPFEIGHTHIRTYKQACYLVDCELNKKIPQRVNKYFLVSLIRITKDEKYKQQIQNKIDGLVHKNDYCNRPKNLRK